MRATAGRNPAGPARQLPGTVSRCSPPWVIPRKRLQVKNQSPKRKCGVSLSANSTPPIARDWVRGARQSIAASFAAEGPYASLLLVAAVRERAMVGKTEQERPLNKRRGKRRKAKMIHGSYDVEQGLSPVFSASISGQAENPRGPARCMLIAVNQATGENGGLPPISARRTALFSMPVECGNRLATPFFRRRTVCGTPKNPQTLTFSVKSCNHQTQPVGKKGLLVAAEMLDCTQTVAL